MPQKVLAVPDWLDPAKRSVFDSQLTQALQRVADFLGVADPQQVMAIGGALEGPGAELGGIAGAVAKRFPRLANAIKAYHGSPHDFEQFDASKIGTGEGAQAYGHGLYFAEQEGIARGYRDRLSPADLIVKYEGRAFPRNSQGLLSGQRQSLIQLDTVGKDDALQQARNWLKTLEDMKAAPYEIADQQRLIKWFEQVDPAKVRVAQQGKMYEVNIHADPGHLLDWDKPLREQPATIQQLFPVQPDGFVALPNGERVIPERLRGETLYRAISEAKGGPVGASQALKDAGVPGMQYLDAGSRAAGEGSRNFVVFDDKTIELLRKYGILAPVAGATIPAVTKPGALAPEAP